MKIALVYNLNRGNGEKEVEYDSPITIKSIRKVLMPHYEVKQIEVTPKLAHWIYKLSKYQPDLILNVAEGYHGPAREAFFPALYEQLGFHYTGPDATSLLVCHNKFLSKTLLKRAGVPVVSGYIVRVPQEIINVERYIRFPAIVKLNSEGSSLGLSSRSIVYNTHELHKQVELLWKHFKSNVLIEDYIQGEDISVAFVEGLGVLGIAKVTFPSNWTIYDFPLKSEYDSIVKIENPIGLTSQLIKRVKSIAKDAMVILDIAGYAKIDFRIDLQERIYILEVNGQVSFHPQGEFMVSAYGDGYTFSDIILHIIKSTKQQKIRRQSVGIYQVQI